MSLSLAAWWPLLGLAALPLALLGAGAGWQEWRRRRAERLALESTVAHLSEFRLPLPPEVMQRLPDLIRPLVAGYETVFAEMHRREAALTARVERYAFMEMHTEDMVMQADAKGLVQYVSPSVQAHLGFTPEELVGQRVLEWLHPNQRETWMTALKGAARTRSALLLEGDWRHKDGHYVTLEMSLRHAYGLNGSVVETISMARNVEARNALRDQLTRAALTDHLTGLPNRAALVTQLERFRAGSAEKPFVLFLFDLDRFKQVNDSLGHAAGDEYLIETANRVRSILRPGDTLARMGGDEFVALFEGVDTESGARSIAGRILDAVGQPYSCQGALLHPKTSIGIVLCDGPDVASDELIMRADRAMYAAKRQGGNLAIVYNGSHSDSMRKDFDVERALTLALQQERLVLHFQPIVDTRTKQPVLAEALVRMRAEDGSLRSPAEFIDVAEKTGQILQVGQWVLEQACWHARRLEEAGTPTAISVNVSPRQLMHVNYVRSVETVLEHTGVSPSSILLEVTESAVMEDVDKAKAVLNHLRSLGFRLALDDFGTGYSSISMLKTLPFDILKIDRAFVREAEGLAPGPTTLGAIIDIGKSLNLTIIAEGIETAEQSLGLERLGCDLLQGFRFHRPMDADAHARLMVQAASPVPHLRLA
ncbi:putative bifunctional diguanylate cyclase/phosphodiesterase [Ideonella sp. BN130291]|uniref:putative bifunctional diguanylate cyclase/phosphodiesterase n=1 Tax=Ideonella sp. BN130291 TaxID=3112940 RepID=UPI002E275EFE|nr:EAL domain-containing protein [Ideonella sp. BN130291]